MPGLGGWLSINCDFWMTSFRGCPDVQWKPVSVSLWPIFACHEAIFTVNSTSAYELMPDFWCLGRCWRWNCLPYVKAPGLWQVRFTILPLKYQHIFRGGWFFKLFCNPIKHTGYVIGMAMKHCIYPNMHGLFHPNDFNRYYFSFWSELVL